MFLDKKLEESKFLVLIKILSCKLITTDKDKMFIIHSKVETFFARVMVKVFV